MLQKLFTISSLAAVALAQNTDASLPDLVTLFNQTRGFGYLSTHVGAVPALSAALSQLTNVTVLAPSNAALRLFPWDPRYEELEAGGTEYFQNLIAYHILEGVHENFTDAWLPYKSALRSEKYTQVTGGQVVIGRWNWRGWETEVFGGRDLIAHAPTVLRFNGGIVYPIDDVLNIPGNLSQELTGQFNGSSFVSALERAGLLDEVQNLTDVTFLVPDDAAFEAVGQSISELSNEDLAEVLRYHIIPGRVAYANLLRNGTNFTTLHGQDVGIYINEEETFVQNAAIIDNNILVSNGVAVLLDNVLNPKWAFRTPDPEQLEGVASFPTGTADVSQGTVTTTAGAQATFTGAAVPLKNYFSSIPAWLSILLLGIIL